MKANQITEKPATGRKGSQELGQQKYIVISDTNGRELTKPMSWSDAEAWVMSPLTKGAHPEGVVIAPASYPEA